MFGIKIINESEYRELIRIKEEYYERIQEVIDSRNTIERDCQSLRQQNSDLRIKNGKLREQNHGYVREVNSLRQFKRDTLEAFGHIDFAGFQLSYCTKKCKHCDNEQHDCRKYEFGTHQYCVIPNQTPKT
jgi:FtsZ-binding cell division protein ZapB